MHILDSLFLCSVEQLVCVSLTLLLFAQPEMVDVVNRLCSAEGCSKHPNFNHMGQSMVRRRCAAGARSSLAAIARRTAPCACAPRPCKHSWRTGLVGRCQACILVFCGAMLAVKAVVCARAGCRPLKA